MSENAKLARREYMRQWRARNKDKVKVHQERYWENKAKELLIRETEKNNK